MGVFDRPVLVGPEAPVGGHAQVAADAGDLFGDRAVGETEVVLVFEPLVEIVQQVFAVGPVGLAFDGLFDDMADCVLALEAAPLGMFGLGRACVKTR